MTGTGFVEQVEISISQVEPVATECCGQVGTTFPMPRIVAFIHSAGIMEQSEELDNFDLGSGVLGQPQAVFQHSGPVGNAMRPLPGQGVVVQDCVDEGFEGEHLTLP